MATFKITNTTSRYTTGFFEWAFGADPSDDTAAADSLIVDASAYLITTGLGSIGAFLNNSKAWTVTVNGSIVAQQGDGIVLEFGVSTASSITVGVDGQVSGRNGIDAQNGATIKNSGYIFGTEVGINLNGSEAHTITNAKGATVEGRLDFAILDAAGLSIDKVTNAGTLIGEISLGGKNDVFTNSGTIYGGVNMGADNDTLTNSGTMAGTNLGEGDNILNNTGTTSGVTGGSGNDKVTNKGTVQFQADLGDGNNSLTNSGVIFTYTAFGSGNDSITNSGRMGESSAVTVAIALGEGANKLVNTGSIFATQSVSGGAGADTFTNSGLVEGSVILGDGNNILTNSGKGNLAGFVTLGAGNDVVNNSANMLILTTGDGDDVVTNTGTILVTTLGGGNDKYTGGAKADSVGDGDGSDITKLGSGDDRYTGTGSTGLDGTDVIDGGAGTDRYDATISNNSVSINLDTKDQSLTAFGYGTITKSSASGINIGNDTITGFEDVNGTAAASDVIYGNAAANILFGDDGNDFLGGFAGNDRLFGDDGNDDLFGGLGHDLLSGGDDNDDFFYTDIKESGATATTRDLIEDFESGDVIWLNPIDADTTNGSAINDVFVWKGTNVMFTGVAGELRAYWSANGQIIEGDVNGDRKADFSIELIRDTDHSFVLTAGDFVL